MYSRRIDAIFSDSEWGLAIAEFKKRQIERKRKERVFMEVKLSIFDQNRHCESG
jgi:hypothetical protein